MDEQGLGAALLFPTLGCGVEEALRDDIPATMASLSAFNRWLEEDWGFDLRGPPLRRADAVARRPRRRRSPRSSRCSSAGVRIVHVRPAPGARPERHEPLARRQAARPGVGPPRRGRRSRSPSTSATAATTRRFAAAWGGSGDVRLRQQRRPRPGRSSRDRAIHDTMAVADRPRRLPAAPGAAGREHRERLGLAAPAGQAPAQAGQPDAVGVRRGPARHACAGTCGSRRTSRRTSRALADLIGVERILFGSDWPHGEGVAQPLDFAEGARRASTSPPCSGSCATTAPSSSGPPRERRERAGGAAAPRRALGRGHRPGSRPTGTPTSPSTRGGRRWPTPAGRRRTSPPEQGGRGLSRRSPAVVRAAFAVVRRAAPAGRPRPAHGRAHDPRPGHARADRPAGAADPRRAASAWCQLFSEPGAGSDLAGLTTRAAPRRRPVGHQRAEGVVAARPCSPTTGCCSPAPTSTCPKHKGISWFAFRLDQPGVTIRPAAGDDRRRRLQRGVPRRRGRATTPTSSAARATAGRSRRPRCTSSAPASAPAARTPGSPSPAPRAACSGAGPATPPSTRRPTPS